MEKRSAHVESRTLGDRWDDRSLKGKGGATTESKIKKLPSTLKREVGVQLKRFIAQTARGKGAGGPEEPCNTFSALVLVRNKSRLNGKLEPDLSGRGHNKHKGKIIE